MPAAIPILLTIATVAAKVATTLLINIAIGAIQRALTKKPKQFAPPVNVTVKNSIENRRVVMGTRRVGGSFVYINTSSSGGGKADLLWYVIAFAGHECDTFSGIFMDNEFIASGMINPTTGVVTGTSRFDGKLKVFLFRGTSSQAVQSDLNSAFAEIDSNFRLRGCCYCVLQMTRDDVAFFQGPPQNVSASLLGLRAYDPRLDSTNGGSGSQRASDPSTWTYTNNPALMARWYLSGGSVHNTGETTRLIRYGLGESDSMIDDAYTIAAANACEEILTGAVTTPGGDGARFGRCDFEFSTGETHRTILQEILDCMAGSLTCPHGKWRIHCGKYDAPLYSFNQDDLTEDLEVQDTSDGSDRYNAVSAVYIQGNAEATTPFRTDAAYEAQDGGRRILREIDLRAVGEQYQAQRLVEIELRKSRLMRTIKITGGLNLLKVAINETFTFSHTRYGWVNKVFRCREKQFAIDEGAGQVIITAREESSAVYADLLTADYATGTSATDEFKVEIPDPPTSLTPETQVTSVKLVVGLPASFAEGAVVQVFEHTASTPFSSATRVAQERSDTFIIQRRDQTTRYYWARIKNPSGAVSDTFPASTGSAGVASFVQTADIADNAATQVSTVTDATETHTCDDAVPDDLQVFATINIPSQSFNYKALVTATANVWKSGAAQVIYFIGASNVAGSLSLGASGGKEITASASPGERISDQFDLDVTAGNTRYFTLFARNNTTPASDVDMRNITLKVEMIKK